MFDVSPLAIAIVVRLLLTGYFVLAAVWDHSIQQGRVPNWLTLPPLALVGALRFYHDHYWGILLFWGVIFLLWRIHLFGGGDAKLLMIEGALFPTYNFVLLTGVCWLFVAGGIELVRAYRGEGWAGVTALGRRLVYRFIALRLGPSEEEFRSGAEPATYLFCLSPILYAWLLW